MKAIITFYLSRHNVVSRKIKYHNIQLLCAMIYLLVFIGFAWYAVEG